MIYFFYLTLKFKSVPKKFSFIVLILVWSIMLCSQNTVSQSWVSITPQYSTNDTVLDISRGIFITKNVGWLSTSRSFPTYSYSHLYKTTDGGNYWSLQKEDSSANAFYTLFAVDPQYCWTINQTGGVFFTTDGGKEWKFSIVGTWTGWDFTSIYFFNEVEGISTNQFRWMTTDGGVSWAPLDTTFSLICTTDMIFASRDKGWIVGECNRWATESGYIANTSDGGKTWQYQSDSLDPPNGLYPVGIMSGINFVDSLHGFAVGNNLSFSSGFIYSTTNGGECWADTQILGSDGFYDVAFLNRNQGWISGDRGWIWSTTDGGVHWNLIETGLNARLGKISVLRSENVVYIFGENNTLLRADIVSSVEGDFNKPVEFSLSQNYPNPFNLETKMHYTIPHQMHTSLKIFDIYGREITILVDEEKLPREYEIDWDAKGVSSGIYFIRLTANNYSQTKKALLLK